MADSVVASMFETRSRRTHLRTITRLRMAFSRAGVEFIEPYRRGRDIARAQIVDPWGTLIELTEGLREMYRTD